MPVSAYRHLGRQGEPFYIRLKKLFLSKSRGENLGPQKTIGCFAVFAYFGQKIRKSTPELETATEQKRPSISRPLSRNEIYYLALITEGLLVDNYTFVEDTELNDNVAVIMLSNERPVINIGRGFKSYEFNDAFPDVEFEYGPNRVWNGIERVLTYETEGDGCIIRGFPATSWLEIAESVFNITINCNRFGRKTKSNYTKRRIYLPQSPYFDRPTVTGDSHEIDFPWAHQYQVLDRPGERMRLMVMHFHDFLQRRPPQLPLRLFAHPALPPADGIVPDHQIVALTTPRHPFRETIEEQRAEYHRQLMQNRTDHRRRPMFLRSHRRLPNVPYVCRYLLQTDAHPLESSRPPSRMANVFH